MIRVQRKRFVGRRFCVLFPTCPFPGHGGTPTAVRLRRAMADNKANMKKRS